MNRVMSFIALILISSSLGNSPATAQTGAGTTRPNARPGGRAIPRIAGLQVGVTAALSEAGKRSEGRVTQIRSDSIWISSGGALTALPLQNVDSAWTLERQTKKGALIGAAAGAAVVAGFGVFLVNGLCELSTGCGNDYPAAVLIGGLIGGSGGGLIGAGVGSLVKSWQRRIPNP